MTKLASSLSAESHHREHVQRACSCTSCGPTARGPIKDKATQLSFTCRRPRLVHANQLAVVQHENLSIYNPPYEEIRRKNVIILLDAQKKFDKILHSFMVNVPERTGTQ